MNNVDESFANVGYDIVVWRYVFRCGFGLLLLMCACCARSEPVVELEHSKPIRRAENVLRVAVPRAAHGLLKHLAQKYMDAHRGRVVLVEDPLAGDGPEQALANGMVDAAVVFVPPRRAADRRSDAACVSVGRIRADVLSTPSLCSNSGLGRISRIQIDSVT